MYNSQTPCYYRIATTLDTAALYKYIEVTVDYYFATNMTIVNGEVLLNATNTTKPVFGKTYLFPTLGA